MSISADIITAILTSSLIASLVTFFLKKIFDRQLEFYFNIRLERLKSELATQLDVSQKFRERRLELYPKIVEIIYRIRNQLRENCKTNSESIDQNLSFVRLAKDYGELIYQARLDLERDKIFNKLHSLKSQIILAENISLDLIHLKTRKRTDSKKIKNYIEKLKKVYSTIDHQHQKTISLLTKLSL